MNPKICLTFDDGLTSQLRNAVPALDARGIPATFFLVGAPESEFGKLDVAAWRDVAKRHEIGSHSVSHRKAASLSADEAMYEAVESKRYLESALGCDVSSFCYPYTDCPDHLRNAVIAAGYKQARAGRSARADKIVTKACDLFRVPCYHVNGGVIERGDHHAWLDDAVRRGGVTVLLLHSVGEDGGWDDVSVEAFAQLLDDLSGFDVKTFHDAMEAVRNGD